MNTKYCTKCGAENDSNARFCVKCGQPFDETSETRLNPDPKGKKWWIIVVVVVLIVGIIGSVMYFHGKSTTEHQATKQEGLSTVSYNELSHTDRNKIDFKFTLATDDTQDNTADPVYVISMKVKNGSNKQVKFDKSKFVFLFSVGKDKSSKTGTLTVKPGESANISQLFEEVGEQETVDNGVFVYLNKTYKLAYGDFNNNVATSKNLTDKSLREKSTNANGYSSYDSVDSTESSDTTVDSDSSSDSTDTTSTDDSLYPDTESGKKAAFERIQQAIPSFRSSAEPPVYSTGFHMLNGEWRFNGATSGIWSVSADNVVTSPNGEVNRP